MRKIKELNIVFPLPQYKREECTDIESTLIFENCPGKNCQIQQT